MLTHHHAWWQAKIFRFFVQCGLALAILFLFSSMVTAAQVPPSAQSKASRSPSFSAGPKQGQATSKQKNDLTLQIDMGYQAAYRTNYWTPVHVSIINNGSDFKGKLTVNVFTGPPRSEVVSIVSPWNFEQSVILQHGMQKQITVYAPFLLGNLIPMGYVATLHDAQGQIAAMQTVTRGYGVRTGDLFIGVLSDLTLDSFNALANVVLPHQSDSLTLSQLDAATMPDNATELKVFDIIILDDFNTSTLSSQQLTTLQTWVNQGGVLIEMGGQDWQRTLSKLPNELLPARMDGIRMLPAGTTLLPIDSTFIAAASGQSLSGNTLPMPVPVSAATLLTQTTFYDNKTLLTAGTMPLIVQARQGQGAICYLAFDLANNPLASWDGAGILWKTILLDTLGDKVLISSNTAISYDIGPGQLLTQGGIINMVLPGKLLEPGLVLLLLLGYVLMLGPIRILIIRRWKLPRLWTWRILAFTMLGFSLLSYGIAAYQKSELLTDNTVSLVQLTQSGSAAHIMTYHGIFVPDQGNITLHIPEKSLALPLSSPLLAKTPLPGPRDEPSASFVTGENDTTLTLSNNKRWTFHPIISEQDTQLQGALTPHLNLHNNRLVGTISNTLNTALSDVYVLLPHGFVSIGHIGAGEIQQIDLPLHNAPFKSGKALADYIAEAGGLPASYFPYTNNTQPQTDFQRHMALLSALNGAGLNMLPCNGSCNRSALTLQNSIVLTGSATVNASLGNTFDPLLVAGAPATLIGWADQQLSGMDNMTINGSHPSGRHESFVRMPLNITPSSAADIPTDFIIGQPIDFQDAGAELIQPGVYHLSASSLLFEFSLPDIAKAQTGSLTIKTMLQPDFTGEQRSNATMQTHLYNWQTGNWDILSQTQGTFTITNPAVYIGKGGQAGQILLQITNPDHAPAPLIFGKPSLMFNGVHQ